MMPEEENKLSFPTNESPPDSSSLSANDNGKQASSTDFGQEALFDESNQSLPKFLPQTSHELKNANKRNPRLFKTRNASPGIGGNAYLLLAKQKE
jgi:hypothetical protein